MAVVPLTTLFEHAARGGYALGYFEAWDSYSLEAVAEAAEAERAPVILGFGCMMADRDWLDNSGIEVLGCFGRTIAERTHVPVALLLNETHTLEQALRGIDAGFNAVMVDTSAWSLPHATEAVTQLVEVAHSRGVAVEAELGRLPDAVEGGIDDGNAAFTEPLQAAAFAERTGIDCLAVSVGNVHLLTDHHAPIDLDHLRAIHARVGVPLVMHGGTSFPPGAVPAAIRAGVLKFNVGTVLKQAFLDGVREAVHGWPQRVNAHRVLGSHTPDDLMLTGKARMRSKIRELMRLYGSSGRA